jgi:anti-sigma-K factor RskA
MAAWLRSLTVWRTASAAGALATVVAITVGSGMRQELGTEIARLQTQLQAAPQIQYVAVLADDKSTASMLVTFDAKAQKLTLQRVGSYHEAGDRSLQLWALPPAGGPKSLGVLGADKLLRLTANEAAVREVPTLAISLEPKGGVPSETGPTGPVLFKGALIQKML